MTAGYSGTPLANKLGIKAGHRVVVVGDPGHFGELVAPLPDAVTVHSQARGKADVAVLFTTERTELERRLASFARLIHPAGAWWVSWPKRSSKVPTDITEDVIRDVVLPHGLVDVKVAAVDETWSGLKLVHRKERR